MTAPKKDPSAMGLLKRVRHECWKFAIGSTAMALGDWIEKELPTIERHARNVDKQRRRLLAEKCDRILLALTHGPTDADIVRAVKRGKAPDYGEAYHLLAARNRRRATKLRAPAERLRAAG
jgi:hypothetical protein